MPRRSDHAQQSGPSQRQLRVGELLRHALVEVLSRGELRDPALSERSITVTEVRVSPDLKAATVFVVPLGGAAAEGVVEALGRCARFLRGRLGHMVELRHVPELRFAADRSFDRAAELDRLLRRVAPRGDG